MNNKLFILLITLNFFLCRELQYCAQYDYLRWGTEVTYNAFDLDVPNDTNLTLYLCEQNTDLIYCTFETLPLNKWDIQQFNLNTTKCIRDILDNNHVYFMLTTPSENYYCRSPTFIFDNVPINIISPLDNDVYYANSSLLLKWTLSDDKMNNFNFKCDIFDNWLFIVTLAGEFTSHQYEAKLFIPDNLKTSKNYNLKCFIVNGARNQFITIGPFTIINNNN